MLTNSQGRGIVPPKKGILFMSNTRAKVIDAVIQKYFEPCCDSQRPMLREAMAEVFEAGMDAGKEGGS